MFLTDVLASALKLLRVRKGKFKSGTDGEVFEIGLKDGIYAEPIGARPVEVMPDHTIGCRELIAANIG